MQEISSVMYHYETTFFIKNEESLNRLLAKL